MESWIITVVVGIVTVIGTLYVMKSKVADGEEKDRQQDVVLKRLEDKIGNHNETLVAIDGKLNRSISMKEVRDDFVSKEIFLQMQKHIDEKFDGLHRDMKDIKTFLRGKNV